MIRGRGTISGLARVESLLSSLEGVSIDAIERGMARGVLLGQSIVRGNARGRPGPRAPTGDFNRSIIGQSERRGATVIGQIGSNRAQARRLELGFNDTDVLGRKYNQPPYPYLSTSIDAVGVAIADQVRAAIAEELR